MYCVCTRGLVPDIEETRKAMHDSMRKGSPFLQNNGQNGTIIIMFPDNCLKRLSLLRYCEQIELFWSKFVTISYGDGTESLPNACLRNPA